MSPQTENFEQLRRLIALKRHEQPPPGYFNDLSRTIERRLIEGDKAEDSLSERLLGHAPWLLQLVNLFEAKPAVAGAFGMVAASVLVGGLVFSANLQVPKLNGAETSQGMPMVASMDGGGSVLATAALNMGSPGSFPSTNAIPAEYQRNGLEEALPLNLNFFAPSH